MMRTGPLTLADYTDLFGWGLSWWVGCLALLVLAVGGFALVGRVRRWLRQTDAPVASGFTLGEMRKLKQEGKITEEEFKRAAALITKAHSAEPVQKPLSGAPKKPSGQGPE